MYDVEIIQETNSALQLAWTASPLSDMVADAVTSIILNLEVNPFAAQTTGTSAYCSCTYRLLRNRIQNIDNCRTT